MSENISLATVIPKSWPDYRAVWRWHFYASIFCIPFVIILSISGAIYLFKPQIEAWNERHLDNLPAVGTPASAAEQIRAALQAVPDATFSSYELPSSIRSAARVIVRQGGESIRVSIHPQTLEVLDSFPDGQRLMRWLFRLHGELLLGDRGSMIVELAASWTVIMILTGLYLWWPRHARGLGGVLYPRLSSGSGIFWKDIHSVTGVWISSLALFLLLSGLPWAKSWGNYLKAVRALTGTAVARQDWSNSSDALTAKAPRSSSHEPTEHLGHDASSPRRRLASPSTSYDLSAVDRIVATVTPLNLPHPVVIAPPNRRATYWTAKSMTPNRPLRINLVLDGATGEVISQDGFQDRHLIDKIISVGIAAHEGQLFGWPNQALGLVTALGLTLLCVSGLILWYRRRDLGVLGAPKVLLNPRISWGLISLVLLIGIYLPLFGTSLLAVLVAEWCVLRRIPRVRHWLGLQPCPQ